MKDKSKLIFLLPLILSVVMSLGLLIGHWLTLNFRDLESDYSLNRIQKLKDVLHIIDKKYVDPVDKNEVFEESISAILHNLDPHSNYIPAEKMAELSESIEGNFGGVGLRFFILRDTICISQIIPNTPSMRAGLKAGDKIIKINNELVAGNDISNEKVMSLLKGKRQTKVNVLVLRRNSKLSFNIIRGTIPIESVVSTYMVNEIGYIKIDQFTIKTAKEFNDAAKSLLKKGMKKMILDLRNNGGGVLQSATKIVDQFLPAGKIIVKTRGKNDGERIYPSSSSGYLKNIPLVILINENSASASEILAGSIQDNDRGQIVGRRSFGKGLVQEDIKLRDGSVVRLTIARYYTPTGRCIQRPYDGDLEEYFEDKERVENGELYAVDSSLFVDSLKFKTPKGKVVYGGGGIMPDVFVPFDSSGQSLYFSNISMSSSIQSFAFDFVSDKRNKWTSIINFNNTFKINTSFLKKFGDYAEEYFHLDYSPKKMDEISLKLSIYLKAEIARQLWVEQGFYQIYNQEDNMFLKAKEILSK